MKYRGTHLEEEPPRQRPRAGLSLVCARRAGVPGSLDLQEQGWVGANEAESEEQQSLRGP